MTAAASNVQFAETNDLVMAYEAQGPANGPTAMLLHGWPDDVRTWDAVAGPLAKAGFRTIAPSLRGFGVTRFHDETAPRSGQPTALACDILQLMDALAIEKATLVGHDWGGRVAYAMAALWPERVERLVVMSVGYETGVRSGATLDWEQQHAYWYQWFFGSERAREALESKRRDVCQYLWRTWAPSWNFTEQEFQTTADSWDNPDWVDVTLHSYRVRWGNAEKDERFAELDHRLESHPRIKAPTAVLHGEQDGASLVSSTANQASSFSAGYCRKTLPGVGHFIPRERPEAIIAAVANAT